MFAEQGPQEQVLRSGRVSTPPGPWWKALNSIEQQNQALLATSTKVIPKFYKQAVSGPDADFWKQGISSELDSLKKHKTWKYVLRSAAGNRKVLSKKWVFVEKQKVVIRTETQPRFQKVEMW